MIGPGWIVAYMALMAALEDSDPITNFILVKTDDFLLDLAPIHDLFTTT
jgi:hypothetical protein